MIYWFCAFYAMTVVSLWMIVCREFKYRRRRSLQGLVQTDALSVSIIASREQRLNGAFSKWTSQRAHSDLLVAAPAVTTSLVTVPYVPLPERPEPQPEPVNFSLNTRQEPLEFEPMEINTPETANAQPEDHSMPYVPGASDYYEVMQISRHADTETIHRVYRIMAARFHPDNPKTGNLERFLALRQANQVLSDPEQRAKYDADRLIHEAAPLVIFELKDFVDGIEGEINRRLGVLSLLYHRRRMHDSGAGLSVLELEKRMSFPREYLDFTLWYLKAKGYIVMEENSDYGLTAVGVDYVESHSCTNRLIRELLTLGPGAAGARTEPTARPMRIGRGVRKKREGSPLPSAACTGRRVGRSLLKAAR